MHFGGADLCAGKVGTAAVTALIAVDECALDMVEQRVNLGCVERGGPPVSQIDCQRMDAIITSSSTSRETSANTSAGGGPQMTTPQR